jgi:hypothetical protein
LLIRDWQRAKRRPISETSARWRLSRAQRRCRAGQRIAKGVSNKNRREWLAGDAVLIAPVSMHIPCKQGILQGILHIFGSETVFGVKKPLCCKHFLFNSLVI